MVFDWTGGSLISSLNKGNERRRESFCFSGMGGGEATGLLAYRTNHSIFNDQISKDDTELFVKMSIQNNATSDIDFLFWMDIE